MAIGREGILPGTLRNNQKGVSNNKDSMSLNVRRGPEKPGGDNKCTRQRNDIWFRTDKNVSPD
jgi:hypothetical protein